jgi:hypothetical protein
MSKVRTTTLLRTTLASFIVLSMAFMGAGCTLFGPKVAVKGRVVTNSGDKDVPVYQALVTIGKAATVRTDYDGTFEVVGVKTGKQSMTIEKEGFETLTETVDIKADTPDLGDLYIVPKEGATITVEPEWILPLWSKSMEALENQTRPTDIEPNTVIVEATIDVVLEQDGGKTHTAGARASLVWTGLGIEVDYDDSLIIMGIEHEAGAGYTITATGTARSDYFNDSIVIQGRVEIAAEEFVDGKYVWNFAIDLSAFLEPRP